jgi:hypothetical protein
MEQWTLYGIIVLAVTILAAIAAILSVKQPSVRMLLLSILGVVGLLAIGAIVVSIQSATIKPHPSPTPTPTPIATPTPTRTPTLTPTPTLGPPTPSPDSPVRPTPIPPSQTTDSPAELRPRSVATPQRTNVNNDIGETKRNEFYEITIENAWTSTDRVRSGNCNFPVPAGQKALFVRFAVTLSPTKSLAGGKLFSLGSVKSTDFIVIDDGNRKLDSACAYSVLLVGENARTTTLAYLISSEFVTFRFQKSGGGDPIVFNLSGVQ